MNAYETTVRLLDYCRQQDWAGYDPYDALNSKVFQATVLRKSRLARLVFVQLMKRSPVNLRPALLVPVMHNPKGTALFLSAVVRLRKAGLLANDGDIEDLCNRLVGQCSAGQPHSCWGYSFDWQQRVNLVTKGTPNIICTTFAGHALLDAQDLYGNDRFMGVCRSASDFLIDLLYYEEDAGTACFSYTPRERAPVHNANLLGAAFLCRVSRASGDERLALPALKAARFSVSRQRPDGSWFYGESKTQRWIDNFHTGFNLCALHSIGEDAGVAEFDDSIRRGLEYFIGHFFCSDGAPRYFHNATFPIDSHSVAQSIITLLTLRQLDDRAEPLAQAVFRWAVANMVDPTGFFYYQKHCCYTVKIPYMRWSEAWMLLALSTLLKGETDSQ